MASYNKTLLFLASKLSLNEEEKVLSKAAEFERLLQTKTVAGSSLSDTSKLVICLDLAAGIFGAELDVKTAIRYSGLKPVAYSSNRKTVENLLELNSSKLTVAQMCVTLQCTGIQDVAEKILEEYQRQAKVELDLSLPQYVCMAVYQAGRINKVKMSKVKINEKCRLKPAQWAMLEADWTKFVNEKFAVASKKRGRPAKNAVVADENQEMEVDSKEEVETVTETEPYEHWRRRMLEDAYRELKEREKENKKSPKKTLKDRGTQQKESGALQKEVRIVVKDLFATRGDCGNTQRQLRGSPKKECAPQKGSSTLQKTPQKDTILQRDLRGTPQKESGAPQKVLRGTPQKESGAPQKVLRGTPQKENGLPKDLRSSAQKDLFIIHEEMSPRKSPRKTPVKFSPYKTPTKGGGVRLLFPNFM